LAEGQPPFVSYSPTSSELLVTVFGLSLILLIYTLGERHLALDYGVEPCEPEADMDGIPKYAAANDVHAQPEEIVGVKR